jgi:hypothetical protein
MMYGGEDESNIRYAAKIQFLSSRHPHGAVSGPLSHRLAHCALAFGLIPVASRVAAASLATSSVKLIGFER